jgi:CheY-like chemotaxis protein
VAVATHAKGAILLVEDDPAVSQTFERMLRLAGYDVVAAPDAAAGLRAMADGPSAVLVDLRMPSMDGLELVRKIRESETNGHRTPIAVITGDYFLEDTIQPRLRALQAELYFKPLWLNDLLQILDKLIGEST